VKISINKEREIIMTLEQFLEKQNEATKNLHIEYAKASWMAATTGDMDWDKKTADAETAYRTYFSNPELFKQVREYIEQGIADPLQKRQLDHLYSGMLENQMPEDMLREMVQLSTELSSTFNSFRATLDGEKVSENDIRQILIKSTDLEKREKAWHASKQIGSEIKDKLLTLVKKRNESARALGYDNYHQISFELQELDRDFVFSTFKKLKELSDEPFRKLKQEMDEELAEKFRIKVEELRPWHYADPFFQEAPPAKDLDLDPYYAGKDIEKLTVDTFRAMGLEITDMLAKSDLYPRDKKNQHAFCSDIDKSGDVRVLCNIDESSYWAETMLHEFGHAVYDKYVDHSLPFTLRQFAHILSTEAIAMFYGRMGKDPVWLETFLGLEREKVNQLKPKIQNVLQRQMLISARWIITFVFFERELYENPDQDLNQLWWKLVEEIQFVHPPEERDYPHWAAKIHFSIAPVYYQNYLLGELTASQLHRHIEDHVSKDIYTPKVGEFLKDEFFFHGARYHWNEKIEKATGEKLNPQHFVDQFVK
jgi:oligoendopeptidase F